MTLSVSSLGKKTQTQRRSCMVLLLWKFSLFIFVWLGQDRPLRLLPGLWALWRPASTTTAGIEHTTTSHSIPTSAAAQYRHTSTYGLSRPGSTHKAEHGDPRCNQPLWRHIRVDKWFDANSKWLKWMKFFCLNYCRSVLNYEKEVNGCVVDIEND